MIGSHIKVGHEYAVCTDPRKGVKDLFAIKAARARVLEKGVQRYAEHSSQDVMKKDGICVHLVTADGAELSPYTIKARDVLMPWSEYEQETERRRLELEAKQAQIEQDQEARREHGERLAARLRDEFRLVQGVPYPPEDHTDFYVRTGSQTVELSFDAMEKMMASISEKVYEILSADSNE